MQAHSHNPQAIKCAIRDWQFVEDDTTKFHTYEVAGILKIVSEQSKSECLRLLRSIVNMYINVRLQRQGVTNHWSRERKLLINYVKKEPWQWQVELLDVAKAYANFENREEHWALITIGGSIVRFDSQIEQINRNIL